MKYLLDTCVISDFVKGKKDVQHKLKSCLPSEISISAITLYEIYYGLEYNPAFAVKIRPMLQSLLNSITILPFNIEGVPHAASLRAFLRQQGTPIGSYDILIAATALAYDLTLVSSNLSEFSRVPGLQIEDWRGAD